MEDGPRGGQDQLVWCGLDTIWPLGHLLGLYRKSTLVADMDGLYIGAVCSTALLIVSM